MTSIPKQCDVVVIGGGPAGSVAAATLAQDGVDVVVFDKQTHPREKVGENLIPDAWRFADAVGATPQLEAAGFIRKAGAMIQWRGRIHQHGFAEFGYDRPAMHVERDRFDHILLKNAGQKGGQIHEGVAVREVDFGDDKQQVRYRRVMDGENGTISCRYVIDASGQSALLGRKLGLRSVDAGFRFMSVWGYFTPDGYYLDKTGVAHRYAQIREVLPVTFVTSLPRMDDAGWMWHIVLQDKVSVGMTIPRSQMPAAADWETFFLNHARQQPVIGRLLTGSRFMSDTLRIINDYSYQSSALAGPGNFLIGDAAGFVDPIFSVGVAFAMFSGSAAGWAAGHCLKRPKAAKRTQDIFAKQLRGRLEVARALALPQYQTSGEPSELARSVIQAEAPNVQQLMHTVSAMTSRSANFQKLLGEEGAAQMGDGHLNRIHDLDLSIIPPDDTLKEFVLC